MGKKLSPILPAYARGKAAAAVAAAATEDKADREEAWTAEEHERFLHALERYGGARCANVHIVWQAMATAVRTRSTIEVKLHAWRYFTFLQETNAEQNTAVDVNVNVSGAQRGGAVVEQRHQQPRKGTEEWTAQDDAHFDELLVLYRKANIDQCPWEAIAARLPGKTARQVRDRYSERQAQMRREEANRRAAVAEAQYAETARRTHTTAPTATTNYPTSSAVRVLLSDLEKDMLFGAMDVVHRSHKGSRDSLESVTAVVIALCRRDSGHSSPPLNTPTFTKADAVAALTRLIRERELNPRRIREYLYNQLRLRVVRSPAVKCDDHRCRGRSPLLQQAPQYDNRLSGTKRRAEAEFPSSSSGSAGVASVSRRPNANDSFLRPSSYLDADESQWERERERSRDHKRRTLRLPSVESAFSRFEGDRSAEQYRPFYPSPGPHDDAEFSFAEDYPAYGSGVHRVSDKRAPYAQEFASSYLSFPSREASDFF